MEKKKIKQERMNTTFAQWRVGNEVSDRCDSREAGKAGNRVIIRFEHHC